MVAVTKILLAAACATSTLAAHGKMTYWHPGLGACGKQNNNNDMVVAIGFDYWHAANPNNDKMCKRTVKISRGGKSVKARVVDKCESCGKNNIDVSPAVFEKLGSPSKGHYQVDWKFT